MADERPASTPATRESDEWPDRAGDLLESTVAAVHTKTVVPLTKVAQIVVFALVLAAAGLAVFLLLIAAVVHIVDAYLPIHPHSRSVWVTYAGLGAIFVLGGAFFMRKRRP
ncbi:MAG: hypothetical protein FWC87_12685 [Acidimicrobiaceae bacterium]|nr:hypothetical protein [Acidimicrobiaceae bacterium]